MQYLVSVFLLLFLLFNILVLSGGFQALLEKLQGEISQAAKKTGIASAAKLATLQTKKEIVNKSCDSEWHIDVQLSLVLLL